VRAIIRNIHEEKLARTFQIGLQFGEPQEELAKIASFCQFCTFFEG
jgi:hypothetical protein